MHILSISLSFFLFTSGEEICAVGGCEWKVRQGKLDLHAVQTESHFSKFDPISVILKAPVFKGSSTFLSKVRQAETPKLKGLWSNIITHLPASDDCYLHTIMWGPFTQYWHSCSSLDASWLWRWEESKKCKLSAVSWDPSTLFHLSDLQVNRSQFSAS